MKQRPCSCGCQYSCCGLLVAVLSCISCVLLQGGQWHDRCRASDGEGEAEPILCALCSEAQELQGHQQQEDPARHVGQGCLQIPCAPGMFNALDALSALRTQMIQHIDLTIGLDILHMLQCIDQLSYEYLVIRTKELALLQCQH